MKLTQSDKDFYKIMLSNNVSIGQYLDLEKKKKSEEIANFIYERFSERYIEPLENVKDKNKKNGFCIMAICCLMIETLVSFYRGWVNTVKRSERAFCYFFDNVELFSDFHGCATEFYKHMRCGILHQAETTGGWRIRRYGPLFDSETVTVNATEFHRRLKSYLKKYRKELANSDWDDSVWQSLRKKMKAVINNCRR